MMLLIANPDFARQIASRHTTFIAGIASPADITLLQPWQNPEPLPRTHTTYATTIRDICNITNYLQYNTVLTLNLNLRFLGKVLTSRVQNISQIHTQFTQMLEKAVFLQVDGKQVSLNKQQTAQALHFLTVLRPNIPATAVEVPVLRQNLFRAAPRGQVVFPNDTEMVHIARNMFLQSTNEPGPRLLPMGRERHSQTHADSMHVFLYADVAAPPPAGAEAPGEEQALFTATPPDMRHRPTVEPQTARDAPPFAAQGKAHQISPEAAANIGTVFSREKPAFQAAPQAIPAPYTLPGTAKEQLLHPHFNRILGAVPSAMIYLALPGTHAPVAGALPATTRQLYPQALPASVLIRTSPLWPVLNTSRAETKDRTQVATGPNATGNTAGEPRAYPAPPQVSEFSYTPQKTGSPQRQGPYTEKPLSIPYPTPTQPIVGHVTPSPHLAPVQPAGQGVPPSPSAAPLQGEPAAGRQVARLAGSFADIRHRLVTPTQSGQVILPQRSNAQRSQGSPASPPGQTTPGMEAYPAGVAAKYTPTGKILSTPLQAGTPVFRPAAQLLPKASAQATHKAFDAIASGIVRRYTTLSPVQLANLPPAKQSAAFPKTAARVKEKSNPPPQATSRQLLARYIPQAGIPASSSIIYAKAFRPQKEESPATAAPPHDIEFVRTTEKAPAPQTIRQSTKATVNTTADVMLGSGNTGTPANGLDKPITEIADKVYRIIERRLRSEQMRKGLL